MLEISNFWLFVWISQMAPYLVLNVSKSTYILSVWCFLHKMHNAFTYPLNWWLKLTAYCSHGTEPADMEVLLIIPLKEISEVDAIGYLQHSIVTHGFSFASFSMFCRQLKIKNTKQMKVFNAAQSRNSLVNCQSAMTAPWNETQNFLSKIWKTLVCTYMLLGIIYSNKMYYFLPFLKNVI